MTWNLEQIASLATILGVLGGLISVYFVAHGISRNTNAIEGATVQSLMSFEYNVFSLVANNASLYLRGCEEITKLSKAERLSFDRIVGSQMSLSYSAFVQFGEHLIDDEVWEAYLNALKVNLRGPGFLVSWKAMEDRYPLSFRTMIEKVMPSAAS